MLHASSGGIARKYTHKDVVITYNFRNGEWLDGFDETDSQGV